MPPLISCICPTYNRVPTRQYLLEEAIEAFLRQTFEDAELLVVNDHGNQRIVFEHPRVRVINLSERFATLGEKYNYAVEQAGGSLICPWEDDDISLPNRLETSVRYLEDYDYFNAKTWFTIYGGRFYLRDPAGGYGHNCSIFRKKAWADVGGYRPLSGPQDKEMHHALKRRGNFLQCQIPPAEAFFIYRFGVSGFHLSARPDTQAAYDKFAEVATDGGLYTLNPHWQGDYVALAATEGYGPRQSSNF